MVLTYEQERALVKGILIGSGFDPEDSDIIGKVITHSDFTGVYSHGLSRLTRYLRQIKVGALNKDPDFKKVMDEESLLMFDGDNGFGILTMNKAYDETLEKAKKTGMKGKTVF